MKGVSTWNRKSDRHLFSSHTTQVSRDAFPENYNHFFQ